MVASGALLLLSARASAETRQLSLREAIELAVRQSPALAAAGAELATAAAAELAARGLDDPVLAASTHVSGTRREWVPGVPVQDRAVDELSGALSLAQPLPTGGRLELELQGGHARAQYDSELSDGARRSSTSARYTPGLQLSFEQPLLRGSGVEVAQADRRRASLQYDVAGAERETLAALVLRDVTRGYWALAHARGELTVRRSSLSAARAQLARVQANIEVGKLPQSATAEIEVAIALRQDSVLAAEQAVIERQLALGRFCGMSAGEPLSAAEELPALDALSVRALDAAATLALALAQSPRLSAARAQLHAGALELLVARDALLPQLDLAIAGGPIGNAPSARAAFDQITGLESYAVMASLALELPLGRHTARGARDAGLARLSQAQLTHADVEAQIATAVAQSVATLDSARRRGTLLAPSLAAAALDLEAEKARFDAGRSSSFDVLRRQDALAAVQLVSLSTRLLALEASAALDALTGEILRRNGVRVRGGGE